MAASLTEPLLTVAIPTCNGAAHIADAVGSVLAQGAAYKLIVVDDRSEDDTLAVVRSIAGNRAKIEVNSEPLGLAGNWNRCIALARTPLVCIFHQDDVMLPGHLSASAPSFAADSSSRPDRGRRSTVIDDRGQAVPATVVEQGGLGPIDLVVEPGQLARSMVGGGNPLRCSAVTLNVAAFRQVGGFDPKLHYVVDWDFWLRMSPDLASRLAADFDHVGAVASRGGTHRFKTGMADLDESAHIIEQLFTVDLRDNSEAAQTAPRRPRSLGPGVSRIVRRRRPSCRPDRTCAKHPAKRDGMFAPPDQKHPERPPPFASNGDSGPRPALAAAPLRTRQRVMCFRLPANSSRSDSVALRKG